MVRAIPPGDLCDTAAGGGVGEGAMVHHGAAQGEASHNARPRLEPMASDHPGAIDGTNREMASGGGTKPGWCDRGVRDTSIHPIDLERETNTREVLHFHANDLNSWSKASGEGSINCRGIRGVVVEG